MKKIILSFVALGLLAAGIVGALYVSEVITLTDAKGHLIVLVELLVIGLIVSGGIKMLMGSNN